jgi:hypothetical protein
MARLVSTPMLSRPASIAARMSCQCQETSGVAGKAEHADQSIGERTGTAPDAARAGR